MTSLDTLISSYEQFYTSIMEYDRKFALKDQRGDLISGFHTRYYSLKDQTLAFLRNTSSTEIYQEFFVLTGSGKPLELMISDDNIEAMARVKECIDFLKPLNLQST